jgi:hypothetical protein
MYPSTTTTTTKKFSQLSMAILGKIRFKQKVLARIRKGIS